MLLSVLLLILLPFSSPFSTPSPSFALQEFSAQLSRISGKNLPPQSLNYSPETQSSFSSYIDSILSSPTPPLTPSKICGTWRLTYSKLPSHAVAAKTKPATSAMLPAGASVFVNIKSSPVTLDYLIRLDGSNPTDPARPKTIANSLRFLTDLDITDATYKYFQKEDTGVPYITYKRSQPATAKLFGMTIQVPFTQTKDMYDGYFRFDFLKDNLWIERGEGEELNCYLRID